MTKPKAPAGGKDITAFRKAYDKSLIVPEKIKAALAALGDSWESEGDFIKRCGLSPSDFGQYRDLFAEHTVAVRPMGKGPTRVWAGTLSFAEKLRETVA